MELGIVRLQLLEVSLLVLGLHVFVFFPARCIKICPFIFTYLHCLTMTDAYILLVDTVAIESEVENLSTHDPYRQACCRFNVFF